MPKRLRETVAGLSGSQALSRGDDHDPTGTVRRLLDQDGVVLAEVADHSVEARFDGAAGPDGAAAAATRPSTWRCRGRLVDGDNAVLNRVGALAGVGPREPPVSPGSPISWADRSPGPALH